MKKIIALLLAAMTLALPALAAADCGCGCGACGCGAEAAGVLVARCETAIQTNVFSGAAWWALTAENRVFGKTGPAENVGTLPANPPRGAWIGGCMDNGVVRDKHAMAVIGEGYGLTSVEVRVELRQDAAELAERIVRERLEVDTITANAIIAATMWWEKGTVCHAFFLPDAGKILCGTITAGKAVIDLYAGEWGGHLVLGFCAGSSPAPTPAPEPEATPAPAPRTEPRPECAAKKTACVKNYYITAVVQINIASQGTQTVTAGKGGCKPCLPRCLEQ